MKIIFKISIFIILGINFIFADMTNVYNFSKDKMTIMQVSGYDQIIYKDLILSDEVGKPQLPYKIVHISLDSDEVIENIIVKNLKSEKLRNTFNIYPVQKPQILSVDKHVFIEPQIQIYNKSEIYPENIIELLPSGRLTNQNICSFKIYPFSYNTENKELIFHEQVEIEIITKQFKGTKKSKIPSTSMTFNKILKSITGNENFELNQSNNYEKTKYIIITSNEFVPGFEPLRSWKYKKGLSAEIITTEWINDNYTGIDLQEKIRNCIKNYYHEKSTEFVLLGGDTQIVPDRKAFAFDCEYDLYSYNYIPCDLYYSDLDGDWNADGDNIYGEIDDNIDMYPDVLVGRAPVENIDEVNAFVEKLLIYEKTTNNHELNMLFLGQVLWHDPYTDSGIGLDHMDSLYVPDRFDPITKLYESLGNSTKTNIINAINSGQNIINHNGHAWHTIMSVGNGSLRNNDMDNLNNKDKYSILYSIGCWPAAIDYNAIAEHFITNPNGGGVAFIGNSRYGWGSPGNPLFGYSDRFNHKFFEKLFIDNITSVGATMAAAKAEFIPLSRQENVYRWCEYEINLLGDPEMKIWTDIPKELTVTSPEYLIVGENQFTISVQKNNTPVANSLICIKQDDGFYETFYTDMNGLADFDIEVTDASKSIDITITAQNAIPYENVINVQSTSAFISNGNIICSGFFDGLPLLNENINIDAVFKNFGETATENLSVKLISNNPKINIIDDSWEINRISALDSISIENVFSFQVLEKFINGESFLFSVEISNQNSTWKSSFSLIAEMPDIRITEINYSDEDGNITPGELVECQVTLCNQGLEDSEKFSVNITSDPNLSISDISIDNNGLLSGQTIDATFKIDVNSGIDTPVFPDIFIEYVTESGFSMYDTISVGIGDFGLFDDAETDNQIWLIKGENNQWHRSELRKNSGEYSWYCGNDTTQKYEFYYNNIIKSKEFYPGNDSKLVFSCWYDFPNYGISGMYVEIINNGDWEVLDFIGSGGALGTLPTGNDWIEYSYDISHLAKNTKTAVRFRVDIDPAQTPTEGIYIDDISVGNVPLLLTGIIEDEIPQCFNLFQNYPNPFNPVTTIKFSIVKKTHVNISIYNIMGELVTSLTNQEFAAGTHSLKWDAVNFSTGIYFYKLKTDNNQIFTKKCLLIK